MRSNGLPNLLAMVGITILSFAGHTLLAQDSAGGETKPAADTPKPARVTMEFKKADLVEAIHLIAKEAGANVVIDPGVNGVVTMRFRDVPWMRALSAVVKTAGYTLVEEDGGHVIRVTDPSKLPMESRVFQFKHIRPDEYHKAKIKTDGVCQTTTRGGPCDTFTLLDTLRNMLTRPPVASGNASRVGQGSSSPTGGRLDYVRDRNCIIVVDTRAVLDQMEALIRPLDVESVTMLLDVTIVTTIDEDVIEMCTRWSSRDGGGSTVGPAGNSPSDNDPVQTTAKYPFHLLPPLAGAPSSATGATFLSDYDMQATLRLFSQDSDTEFVVRPNFAITSDRGARFPGGIFVGEEIHYDTESGLGCPPLCKDPVITQRKEEPPRPGVLQISMGRAMGEFANGASDLYVIPHLVVGTDKFILTVIPSDEGAAMGSSQVEGFGAFQAPSGGSTEEVGRCRLRATVVKHMLIESGQTAVLAWPCPDGTPQRLQDVRETNGGGAGKAPSDRVFLFICPHTDPEPASPR